MNETRHASGESSSAFEARLKARVPSSLPVGFLDGVEGMAMAHGRSWMRGSAWFAMAALLLVGLWIGWVGVDGLRPKAIGPEEEAVVDASSSGDVGSDWIETTDVIAAEDAGTVPSDDGLYRIVRVMLVHRTFDPTVDADPVRIIEERTSEQYVAIPLEIF